MSEEDTIIAAIRETCDPLARLAYADWLGERNDPRAEYLWLEQCLVECQRKLEVLHATIDQDWLRKMNSTYRAVLLENRTPYELTIYTLVGKANGLNYGEIDEELGGFGNNFYGRYVIKSGIPHHEAERIAASLSQYARIAIERDEEPEKRHMII